MEIVFLRHGPAGEKESWARTGRPDSERPLTAEGKKSARSAVKGLAAFIGSADVVATSPWARARQTAELAAKVLGASIVETDLLLPQRTPHALARWLSSLDGERVVLVGHEPHLSKVITWLMTGNASPPVVRLKKAQAVMLETEDAAADRAALIWSLPSKALRRLT